jgi:hypothetical protein
MMDLPITWAGVAAQAVAAAAFGIAAVVLFCLGVNWAATAALATPSAALAVSALSQARRLRARTR